MSLSALSDNLLARISEILAKYPQPRAALLPILNACQREYGFISPETEAAVAELVGIPVIDVRETVSFYSLLQRKPVGKYHLQFCTNLSCSLLGAEESLAAACRRLGVHEGETTPENKFTITTVECLGACDMSPSLQVNDDYYANMTPDKVNELLDKLK
ncbi:MAG TPA: NAD(P)H-dependent oxidoreductase subunit E [Acidobacteriota bacterium]|jgi:NADH-quinone oxidoreductase E subunit|nr:NAD(P)H-dependent oxidoreductase subunit E [Acidobacteriota bacterium]